MKETNLNMFAVILEFLQNVWLLSIEFADTTFFARTLTTANEFIFAHRQLLLQLLHQLINYSIEIEDHDHEISSSAVVIIGCAI